LPNENSGATPIGTRAQVLRVALDLFRTQGYDGTSLRQIAERLGITKAALYYHFPAKEHLIIELTRPFLDALAALLASARDQHGEPFEQRRLGLLGRYLDLFIEHHEVIRLLATDTGAIQHPDVGTRGLALIDALNDELTGPDGTEEERIRVGCALGALNSIATLSAERLPVARDIVLQAALAALEPAEVADQRQQRG
jgi:AcrR family transcriptional regulator